MFEDVQALANYSNEFSEYQRILERLTMEYQERKQEYEAAQEEVADFLPAGKSIVHEYQGEYYDIKRDGAGRLTVRRMNIEEYQRRRQRPRAF